MVLYTWLLTVTGYRAIFIISSAGRFPCSFSNVVAPTVVLVLTKDNP
jgi:hypothetical protein